MKFKKTQQLVRVTIIDGENGAEHGELELALETLRAVNNESNFRDAVELLVSKIVEHMKEEGLIEVEGGSDG
jgi:predicted alpha-1,6-mannanase (GH76 family)